MSLTRKIWHRDRVQLENKDIIPSPHTPLSPNGQLHTAQEPQQEHFGHRSPLLKAASLGIDPKRAILLNFTQYYTNHPRQLLFHLNVCISLYAWCLYLLYHECDHCLYSDVDAQVPDFKPKRIYYERQPHYECVQCITDSGMSEAFSIIDKSCPPWMFSVYNWMCSVLANLRLLYDCKGHTTPYLFTGPCMCFRYISVKPLQTHP